METNENKNRLPTPEELEKMMVVPKWLVNAGIVLLQLLIYGLPTALVVLPILYSPGLWFTALWLIASPLVFAFLFGTIAGLLSLPWQAGIVKGVFPRDVRFPIYALRRLYGICWTSVYYFKPVYSIILSIPFFTAVTFRLFGYKGSLNITIFPDTWIRDLPLLRIDEGVYIANRATLGTNVNLTNGNILVGNVTLKKGALVGHRSNIGLGVTLGEGSEIGINCTIGLHAKIGNNSQIGGASGISHGSRIGNNTEVGVRSFVGTKAMVADNLSLPSDIQVPDECEVKSQSDVKKYVRVAGQEASMGSGPA